MQENSKCRYISVNTGEWQKLLNTRHPNITHRMQSQTSETTPSSFSTAVRISPAQYPQRLRHQTQTIKSELTLSSTQVTRGNCLSQLAVVVAWEKTGGPAYYLSLRLSQRRASSTQLTINGSVNIFEPQRVPNGPQLVPAVYL